MQPGERPLIAVTTSEIRRHRSSLTPQGEPPREEMALGLNYWKMMGLIVLPQALRIVIPVIVNTFIGLFKDTTLVTIIGLFDLLGTVQAATRDVHIVGLERVFTVVDLLVVDLVLGLLDGSLLVDGAMGALAADELRVGVSGGGHVWQRVRSH